MLKAFSTRRAEIEERMAIRGQHSPKAAMVAALDTRRSKEHDPGAIELRARWTERADELGFDPPGSTTYSAASGRSPISDADRREIEDRLLGADGLTAHDSSFERNDILRAWCDALPAGAPIEQLEDLAESLIDRMQTAPLHGIVPGKGAVIRDASGGPSRRCRPRSGGRPSSCSTSNDTPSTPPTHCSTPSEPSAVRTRCSPRSGSHRRCPTSRSGP